MGVEPVRPRVGHRELVIEHSGRWYFRLSEAGHAVHVVAQGEPVPVHGSGRREVVDSLHTQDFTLANTDLLAGYPPSVCPRLHLSSGEVELSGSGVQSELSDRGPLGSPGRFHCGNSGRIRGNALWCRGSGGVPGAGREKSGCGHRHAQTEELAAAKQW